METDRELKVLFHEGAADLMQLTGDEGAELISTDVLEVQAVRRTVDFVLRLRRHGCDYFRHLEFQGAPDAKIAERCFRYNAQLNLQYQVPVATTVIFLFPPAPRGGLEYRVRIGRRTINRWRFEVLKLWDLDAKETVDRAGTGVLPLVPFMGREEPLLVARAGQRIRAEARPGKRESLLGLLAAFASKRYSRVELEGLLGKEACMDLPLLQEIRAEGKAEGKAEGEAKGLAAGRAEGRLMAERELCLEMARKHHSAVLDRVSALVTTCQDADRLRRAILGASEVSSEEFCRQIAGP